MKKVTTTLVIIALCFISCKKEVKTEVDTPKDLDSIKTEEPAAEAPVDSASQMKAWQAYSTPGAPHKLMTDEVGTWNCEMTFWHEPNGKPEKSTSVATIKMILGGRYQESNYVGKIMGAPFEGKSTLAYNNASKEYTTTFIDNMGTGMMVATGKYDEGKKSMEFKGEVVNPVTGKKAPYREIYTIVDATTRKMEMFDVKEGAEYKSMEIVMKKK
ncbi:DUF1579 domain-containing protein [Flavobacterium sp. WLB]|uniref:DUF1579 domain-containing protein n=1 Tax=unclassified Flavobacterium TaxID=196869 RepID=UPI0006AB9895|nr:MULTISPECIES: DUF1579 domain-containing protein [unclassified Flavobacterium]KOP35862.1 hypothetical protein AKO67_23335 [Flavobacterium sp. VMW]OWU89527.1 hypothetical protein APR43_17270 [Flavobacterium sp. NLM]PUU71760.1 DUF1579 domain-containing protein [Flavobacterium sp. WLB]